MTALTQRIVEHSKDARRFRLQTLFLSKIEQIRLTAGYPMGRYDHAQGSRACLGAATLVSIACTALDKPYTFVVMALLLLILGPLAAIRMPADIFPAIRIPVIAVAFSYTGLPPDQMSGRICTLFQRGLTTTVNDIEHIEANSYIGICIIKIFFQPA